MNTKTVSFVVRFFSIFILLSLLFSAVGVTSARAAGILYATPSGTGNCSSWENTCTLQTALTSAVSGDEIWVSAGAHKPTTIGTDRSATFQPKDGVAVYGGFAGTEAALDQRNPAVNITILSGDIDNNDSQTPVITDFTTVTGNITNSYHVVTGATGATLDGFIITAGNANGTALSPNEIGGGMYNDFSSPILTNITFSGNLASNSYDNFCCGSGGGMYNHSSGPILTNVTFSNNSAGNSGGGMYNDSSTPVLTNVTFSGNSATGVYGGGYGGAIYNWRSNPTLTNVTFNGNSAGANGGGMLNADNSIAIIHNAIFWANSAPNIYNGSNSSIVMSDSVMQGGCPLGSTCTNIFLADPKLGALGNYGGSTQTIPLLSGSSAIDNGNDATCAITDQRGVTRPQGAHCDIGSYELIQPPVSYTKTTPINTASNIPTSISLNWGASSGATSYEYCYDSNPGSTCESTWISTEANTSVMVSSLNISTTYYWQVRANGLGGTTEADGGSWWSFTTTSDSTPPTVLSITRADPNPTSATSANFTVTFSESVTGVDSNDFGLTTNRVLGVTLGGVSGSGSIYTVSVNTGTGNGNIRLNVIDNNSIVDGASNLLGGMVAGDGDFATGEFYTIIKSATFADVPLTYWANNSIERLYNASITGGCMTVPLSYCPTTPVTRAQMAIFLLRGMHGSTYTPPAATGTKFIDVPLGTFGAAWIEQLAVEGITSGCGGGNYCPTTPVSRAQMAIFLVRAKHGIAFTPPTATGLFTDVPVGSFGANYIEQLSADAITSGCGGTNYCPNTMVKRDSMAVFLVKTFNLP